MAERSAAQERGGNGQRAVSDGHDGLWLFAENAKPPFFHYVRGRVTTAAPAGTSAEADVSAVTRIPGISSLWAVGGATSQTGAIWKYGT